MKPLWVVSSCHPRVIHPIHRFVHRTSVLNPTGIIQQADNSYPEQQKEHSKSVYSQILCGNATRDDAETLKLSVFEGARSTIG